VIDEQGNNLGIMKLEEALKLAQQKGVDLVEISPTAKPPVTRLISYDKFRYQEEKKRKKQRLSQKTKELKSIRISPRAAQNDLQIKAKMTEKFLNEGHIVEINIFLKGREKTNQAWALQKIKEFIEMIKIPYQITTELRQNNKGYSTQLIKKQ
jgi:translation initiation factor IF-3